MKQEYIFALAQGKMLILGSFTFEPGSVKTRLNDVKKRRQNDVIKYVRTWLLMEIHIFWLSISWKIMLIFENGFQQKYQKHRYVEKMRIFFFENFVIKPGFVRAWPICICNASNIMNNGTKKLTFDLEGWPWPLHFTDQNVRLHEIHMYAKYKVSTCNSSKVMTNVKVGRKHTNSQTHKYTNQPTNRQGKNNISPQNRLGDIKNVISWIFTTVAKMSKWSKQLA